jgi:hypothetical protein
MKLNSWNSIKQFAWLECAVLPRWGFRRAGICWWVSGSHHRSLEYFKLLFYLTQSFSMSFQITFQSETVTTMTVEMFLTTVQSHVSLQSDLPSECLPTDQHTKPFSPHCIIKCHIKYRLSLKEFWNVAHVYRISTVWIINCGIADRWFNRLMDLWEGRGFVSTQNVHHLQSEFESPRNYSHYKGFSSSKHHKKCNAMCL